MREAPVYPVASVAEAPAFLRAAAEAVDPDLDARPRLRAVGRDRTTLLAGIVVLVIVVVMVERAQRVCDREAADLLSLSDPVVDSRPEMDAGVDS